MPVVLIARRARCRKNESFVGVRHLQACARAGVRGGRPLCYAVRAAKEPLGGSSVCLRIREIEVSPS